MSASPSPAGADIEAPAQRRIAPSGGANRGLISEDSHGRDRRPLLIVVLVLPEVGMWQWRMVIAARGRRLGAVLLGTAGAVLQITAITQVATNIGDPFSVAAYAAGVGLGVLDGLAAGDG